MWKRRSLRRFLYRALERLFSCKIVFHNFQQAICGLCNSCFFNTSTKGLVAGNILLFGTSYWCASAHLTIVRRGISLRRHMALIDLYFSEHFWGTLPLWIFLGGFRLSRCTFGSQLLHCGFHNGNFAIIFPSFSLAGAKGSKTENLIPIIACLGACKSEHRLQCRIHVWESKYQTMKF